MEMVMGVGLPLILLAIFEVYYAWRDQYSEKALRWENEKRRRAAAKCFWDEREASSYLVKKYVNNHNAASPTNPRLVVLKPSAITFQIQLCQRLRRVFSAFL
jgi:hypothetical protein